MKLTILGSGTWVTTSGKNSAAHLIETEKNNLLFDIGRGTTKQLFDLGKNLQDIDVLFITHLHQDHTSEIVPFIFSCMTDYSEKLGLRNKKLKIYGPRGTKKFIKRIYKTFHIRFQKEFLPPIIEVKDGQLIRGSDYSVKVFQVEHGKMKSFAYRISSKRKVITYSGDTTFCEGIIESVKNVDLALIEATSDKLDEVHLTGEQVGKLAKNSNVKYLVITHVAPDYLPFVVKDIKKYYNGKLRLAKDGQSFKI